MGARFFEFDDDAICDVCGEKGAYDVYGDYFCDNCLLEMEREDDFDEEEW